MTGTVYLPEEGIVAVGRQHLEVLLEATRTFDPLTGPEATDLERAGMFHRGQPTAALGPFVGAFARQGPWLLLQTRTRGDLIRTSILPRATGVALVTRLPAARSAMAVVAGGA
jgi:hypothetical protein